MELWNLLEHGIQMVVELTQPCPSFVYWTVASQALLLQSLMTQIAVLLLSWASIVVCESCSAQIPASGLNVSAIFFIIPSGIVCTKAAAWLVVGSFVPLTYGLQYVLNVCLKIIRIYSAIQYNMWCARNVYNVYLLSYIACVLSVTERSVLIPQCGSSTGHYLPHRGR